MEEISVQHVKFTNWSNLLVKHALPEWDDFPNLELYMDQVVMLVSQYMSHLAPVLGEDKPITPAMINNYVKMGLLVPPVKKRYSRAHLACLIIICVLKRSLTMAAIQKIMPPEMSEEEIAQLYESFRKNRKRAIDCVAAQVNDWNGEIFYDDPKEDDKALVIRLAVMANLFKISAEELVEIPVEVKPKKNKQ